MASEFGGQHQHEAALSGLPLLYRNSGALPESCAGSGIMFDGPGDFEAALERLLDEYPTQIENVRAYPHTSRKCVAEYLALFDRLLDDRSNIVARRSARRQPLSNLLNRISI